MSPSPFILPEAEIEMLNKEQPLTLVGSSRLDASTPLNSQNYNKALITN
jgi:hypothetical protein